MRKKFEQFLHAEMSTNKSIVLLTADLGYGLWDRIRIDYPHRFVNFGSAEQLMIGAACGMSLSGKIPVAYSITPFLLYRPYELIRNFLNKDKINVKLVGGGRDSDYGYLGFTHWGHDDIDVMSNFTNINLLKPKDSDNLNSEFKLFIDNTQPGYLNLSK